MALSGFLDGRLHEYGTTLLLFAGLFNLLAISSALELRKETALMPHLAFTLLVAVLLSVALSLLGNRGLHERLNAAIYIFLTCVAATVAGSWTMYLLHG